MKKIFIALFLLFPLLHKAQNSSEKRVTSTIDSLTTEGLILQQTFNVNATLDKVWNAYTTEKGWKAELLRLLKSILKKVVLSKQTIIKKEKLGMTLQLPCIFWTMHQNRCSNYKQSLRTTSPSL